MNSESIGECIDFVSIIERNTEKTIVFEIMLTRSKIFFRDAQLY